jgi:crossover junction endodeoxyribonuclease RuvC
MNTLAPGATGRKILGIDLGLGGAIAVLDMEATLVAGEDMPALADGTAKRRTINSISLAARLREHGPIHHAFVEFVSSRPGEGPVGAFAFGRGRGIVEGVLGSLAIPMTLLTPACWKRVGLAPGTNKDASRSMAIARWPDKAEWFKRKMDNGRSDAALIGVAGPRSARTSSASTPMTALA